MNQKFDYYLNQFRLQPDARRFWPKALGVCAALGGIYGASLGAALGSVPPAANVIAATAAILAFVCGVPGVRIGYFYGAVNRVRYGELFLGTFAAIAGAILGGCLATLVLLALGAILGAICGWCVASAIMALRPGVLRRFLGGIAGLVLGMFLGAILWAVRLDPTHAPAGTAWGLGIGTVAGPLLFLLFIGTLRSLPPADDGDRGDYIDNTFRDQ